MPFFIQGSFRFEIGKIVCLEFEDEKDPPVVFTKPATSVVHQDDDVLTKDGKDELAFSLYYAMAMGRRTESSKKAKMSSVLGFGMLLDIFDPKELSKLRKEGLPWDLTKGRDTFCPISEFTSSKDIGDPYGHEVYLEKNGREVRNTSTRELQMGLEDAMQHVSESMTLAPGDIIAVKIKGCDGTLAVGDEIEAGISSVGIIRNRIAPPLKG
ncbi:MAG: fumarylacetoacetate hydrolase family protein [Thermoplasmatota archaeon]